MSIIKEISSIASINMPVAKRWNVRRCRYAPEGSVVTLSAEAMPEKGVALFRIMDKGPGIPQELRGRVFERFFRVEKHRGGQISTGLGLSICKHIIERHGGRVYVDDGEGCVMCFTVPLA